MSSEPAVRDPRRIIALVLAVVVLVSLIAWLTLRTPATTQVEPAPTAAVVAESVSPTPSPTPSSSTTPTPSSSTTPTPSSSTTPSAMPSATPSAMPSATPSATAFTTAGSINAVPPSSPPPVASPSSSPSRAGYCQPTTDDGFEPVRFEIERFGADENVLSLGVDADGAIAAPPKNQARTASWWNQGPRAGATQGKTVLSIHTYRRGGALGNQMYEGGASQLQPGDRIVLHGSDGQVACYDFVEAKKIAVEDYDPASNMMVDYDGSPMLTMIICWDHRKGTDLWDSRVFFYATPVVGD